MLEVENKRIEFDIIIPCFNNLVLTKQCIDSLRKNTRAPFRLILVDDCSTDGTRDYFHELKKKIPNVKVIIHGKNLGFTQSVIDGMRASVASFIVVLNNDIVITSEWTEETKKIFKQNPKIGMLGPAGHVELNKKRYKWAYKENGNFKFQDILFISGSRTIIKREVLTTIGHYDPAYSPGYYEDVDFSLRAVLAGFELYKYVIPSVHERNATFKNSNWKMSQIQSCNRKYLLRKFKRFLTTGKK